MGRSNRELGIICMFWHCYSKTILLLNFKYVIIIWLMTLLLLKIVKTMILISFSIHAI